MFEYSACGYRRTGSYRVRCRRTLLHDRDMLSCGNHLKKLLADGFRVCDFEALDQAARRTLTLVLAVFGGWSLSRDRNSRNRQYFRGAKSLVCALASLSGWRTLGDPGAARDFQMAGRTANTTYYWPISADLESFSSKTSGSRASFNRRSMLAVSRSPLSGTSSATTITRI